MDITVYSQERFKIISTLEAENRFPGSTQETCSDVFVVDNKYPQVPMLFRVAEVGIPAMEWTGVEKEIHFKLHWTESTLVEMNSEWRNKMIELHFFNSKRLSERALEQEKKSIESIKV